MLKNILKLNGAQQLSNNEQKSINGGIRFGCQLLLSDGQNGEIIPADESDCPINFPVFHANYYGQYRNACCTY